MTRRIPCCALVALALLLAGCPEEEPVHVDVVAECDNTDPLYCMLPWPSSRYLEADPSTNTGWRVAHEPDAFPLNIDGDPFDVAPYNRQDGFPPSAQILTLFEAPLDTSTLPPHWDYDASLAADSPTVLLDMTTGERVAHFAEQDEQFDDPAEKLLYIRPAQRLAEDHRYAVALRDLRHEDGGAVEASPVFAALRDGTPTDSDQVEARRASFEEVFTALQDAGVERASLIQAWDFHTASGETLWGDLLAMRDDALQRLGEDGIGCTITEVDDDPDDEHAHRHVKGTYTVPRYVDSEYPPARLVYGADGRPAYQGEMEVEFHATIPASLAEPGADPGRFLTYGHGFFLGGFQVTDPWQTEFADELGFVMVGTNWAGMSEDDILAAAQVLSDMSDFPTIPDRLHQGVINVLALTRTMGGVCTLDPAMQVDGVLPYDPAERYFLGISLGSILGTTTITMSTDIERAVLHVGGAIFPLMESRSINFEQFDIVYSAWYERRIDREFYWSVIGHQWDRAEPITYLPHIAQDPLPGTPAKQIFYPVALQDAEVANVASDVAARTAGFAQLGPTMHEVWGVETITTPTYDGSAIQYWDCGDPDVPLTNEPPEDNSAHQCVRRTDSFAAALDAFLRPGGTVTNACDGPCDPE